MKKDNGDWSAMIARNKKHMEHATSTAGTEDPEIRIAEDKHEHKLVKMETGERERWTIGTPIQQSPDTPMAFEEGSPRHATAMTRTRVSTRPNDKPRGAMSPDDSPNLKSTAAKAARIDRQEAGIEPRATQFDVGEQSSGPGGDVGMDNGNGGDLATVDVSEVYSPERVVPVAVEHGLTGGSSMGVTTVDKYGRPWDFSRPEVRRQACTQVIAEDPAVLLGSVMCRDVRVSCISIGLRCANKKRIVGLRLRACILVSCARYTAFSIRREGTTFTSILGRLPHDSRSARLILQR